MENTDLITVGHLVKDCRKILEPALKPLEGEIRGEMGMGEMAKLSTMLLTYNMDKALSTPDACKNYIMMQDVILGVAQRVAKLPDIAASLPDEARGDLVKSVLTELNAKNLLAVLQGAGNNNATGGFMPAKADPFGDL